MNQLAKKKIKKNQQNDFLQNPHFSWNSLNDKKWQILAARGFEPSLCEAIWTSVPLSAWSLDVAILTHIRKTSPKTNLLRWRWGFINYAGERNGRTSNHMKFAIVAFDSGPRGYNSEVEDQRMKSRSGRNLEKLEIRKSYVTVW